MTDEPDYTHKKYYDVWKKYADAKYKLGTIGPYSSIIRSYLSFLDKNVEDTNYDDLEYFLNLQSKKGKRGNSISNDVSAIRSFYEFLFRKYPNLLDKDEVRLHEIEKGNFISRSPEAFKRKPISKEEFRKLIATPKSKRNALIIGILGYTGIRNNELCHVRIEDLELEENTLFIAEGKNNNALVTNSAIDYDED